MSTNDLLRPRYKVIAIWPGMHLEPFGLHQVVTLQPHKEEDAEGFIYIPNKHVPGSFMWESFFTLYKNLFKRLEWWEDLTPEQVPKYIKSKDRKEVREVIELTPDGFKAKYPERPKGYRICYNPRWLPATKAEYETYINQNSKQ